MDFDDLPFSKEETIDKTNSVNNEIEELDELPFEKSFSPVMPSNTQNNIGSEETQENIEVLDDFVKSNPLNENNSNLIKDDLLTSIQTYEPTDSNEKNQENEDLFENLNNRSYIPNLDDNIINLDKIYETEKKESFINKISDKFTSNLKVLPVIAFVFVASLGIYLFSTNIKADEINLIRIEENQKVGYINNSGEVLAKPKYISGTDFYRGYAIVKNYNNLSGVLNSKAKLEVPFGNFFYVDLYSDRYIVSKFTNEGLKQGLLDENLNELTRFNYDNLSYSKSGLFLFVRGETMGLMNKDGKEIYSYVVDEVDNRDISIEISSSDEKVKYAKIKINSSSTIINIETGKEVYKYTLSDIYVLDNNVFYIRSKNEGENNKYFVIKNDKVVYETSNYKRLRVEDISSNIAIGIKEDSKKDYINLNTKEVINSNVNNDYEYSDGVILEKSHNFTTDKDDYRIINANKTLGEFSNIKSVDNLFVNGFMKIYSSEDKYGFIDKKGKVITEKGYDDVSDFSSYGYAFVLIDKSYGVINTSGKEIIKPIYDEIVFLDEDLFENIKSKNKEELFIFRVNDKYGIINSKGKILIKPIYNSFSLLTTKYPIIKATYNNEELLINLDSFDELTMKISGDVNIYENHIVIDNKYYNYSGKLIYEVQ